MKRSTKGLLFLGGASLFYSAGALAAPPWASAQKVCSTDVYGTPIPCKPGETPPTTVLIHITPYCPPGTSGAGCTTVGTDAGQAQPLPPPVEGATTSTSTANTSVPPSTAPTTSPPTSVDATAVVPTSTRHPNGSNTSPTPQVNLPTSTRHPNGSNTSPSTPQVNLPAAGLSSDDTHILIGIGIGLLFAGVVLVIVKRKGK